jgi:RHS repeat-associated protein
MHYDAAGNVTTDNLGNMPTYDSENRIATVAGYTYSYDADGARMEKAAGSTGTMYWLGPYGTLSETNLAGTINEEYIYFNGARIARVDRSTGIAHYYFSDKLASTSVITSPTAVVQEQYYYYPYGGTQSSTGSDSNNYKFTGKERDAESSLDYFGARHYTSTMGRFMSADRYNAMLTRHNLEAGGLPSEAAEIFLYGYIDNPQNWNQYAYVRNNPLNFVDPTGAAAVPDGHHLFSEREGLGPVARNFTNAIKTGPLSGNGFPNQPGFNTAHREYNEAVEEVLQELERTEGDRNGWSIPQWKDAATQILNSTRPAIRNFLDDLEANNPGAKVALSAAIAAYRVTVARIAAIVGYALLEVGSRFTIIIYFDFQKMRRSSGPEADWFGESNRFHRLQWSGRREALVCTWFLLF